MLLIILLLTFKVSSEEEQLKCGDNLEYVLNNETLTISGQGQMYNFTSGKTKPWKNSLITKIIIEEGVTSIGDYAFKGSQYLESVELSNTITYIGEEAFCIYPCISKFSLIIPNSVTHIGTYSFYGANIVSIQLSNSLKTIPRVAFRDCKYLQSLEIPEGVVTIEDYAFADCNRLTNVTFPSTLENIHEFSFSNCPKIESIVLQDNVKSIGKNAFDCCTSLVSVTLSKQLTEISESLFEECTNLESIVIPENLQIIGILAFNKCKNLGSMKIPSGVTTIGYDAFASCAKITSIELPKGLTVIDSGVFSGCSSLESLTIHGEITYVGSSAFSGCYALASIPLPDTVATIETSAFRSCNLTSFKVPPKITSISDSCFRNCNKLQSITLHEGITSIGNNSFYYCNSLVNIDIPKSVEAIGDQAFNHCDLRNVTIHENVAKIGKAAFTQNLNLDFIEVDENNKVYKSQDGILIYNLKTILAYPANKNASLYEIPDSITFIAQSAFQYAQHLETLIIHAGVTSISEDSFSDCSKLSSVTYYGTKNPSIFPVSFFKNCKSLTSVNVTTNYTSDKFGNKPVKVMKNDDDIDDVVTSSNEGNEQTSENIQISDNNQNSENIQISDNIQNSENIQISDNNQNSENIQNSEEETNDIIPIPDATQTPRPDVVIVDIPSGVNETELDDYLKEQFSNNSFSDNNNKVLGFTNDVITFDSKLDSNEFIKPIKEDSKIVYKGGNLNLVLPTKGKVTVSIENDKSSLSINGEGQMVIDKSGSQSSSVEIESKSRINGSVEITVSDKIDTLTIESIEFDKTGSLLIKKDDPNKPVNLSVKHVSTKQNSKVTLRDASILDSLTVSQSSTIALNNVSLTNANVNFDLNNNNWTPFLNGVFNDPPKNIFLNKVSDENNSPSKNEDYTLVVGQFEENKCEEWLSKIDYKDSGFNSKSCQDNSERLRAYENQKIVIKRTDKKGNGLTGGQIAGIVIGCVAAVAIVVVVVIIVLKKKKNADDQSESESI